MKKFNLKCPVPLEQQPLNEYESLKESIFFFWTTKEFNSYIKVIIGLTIFIYSFSMILINTSFSEPEPFINVLKHTVFFSSIILFFFCLRIYLGWIYIYGRLIKASVSYEESGWYDGQTWIKTPTILMQDRLIAEYILLPILTRLKNTIFTFTFLIVISGLYLKVEL